MAVEKFLKLYSLLKLGNNSLPVLSCSINSFTDWIICRLFGGSDPLLVSGNYGGASCGVQNETGQRMSTTDILSVLWMAAPKKRTSRKTKWLRHQRKFIKNREDIETCSVCGNAKLINHLCGTCFERIQKATGEVLKDIQIQPSFCRQNVPENLKHLYKK